MDFITQINSLNSTAYMALITFSGIAFAIAWSFDSRFHGKIYETDITDKEMQTHRLILLPSVVMELSLVLMYWFPTLMLPVFIATYFTRTAQEFIDELHWHTDRCSFYESLLHMIMWCALHTKTIAWFFWAFFTHYKGIESVPGVLWVIFTLTEIYLFKVSFVEWNRKVK